MIRLILMNKVSFDGLTYKKVEASGKYPAFVIEPASSEAEDESFSKFLTYLSSGKGRLEALNVRQVMTTTAPGQAFNQYQNDIDAGGDGKRGLRALRSGLDLLAGRMVPMGDPIIPVMVIDASCKVYDQEDAIAFFAEEGGKAIEQRLAHDIAYVAYARAHPNTVRLNSAVPRNEVVPVYGEFIPVLNEAINPTNINRSRYFQSMAPQVVISGINIPIIEGEKITFSQIGVHDEVLVDTIQAIENLTFTYKQFMNEVAHRHRTAAEGEETQDKYSDDEMARFGASVVNLEMGILDGYVKKFSEVLETVGASMRPFTHNARSLVRDEGNISRIETEELRYADADEALKALKTITSRYKDVEKGYAQGTVNFDTYVHKTAFFDAELNNLMASIMRNMEEGESDISPLTDLYQEIDQLCEFRRAMGTGEIATGSIGGWSVSAEDNQNTSQDTIQVEETYNFDFGSGAVASKVPFVLQLTHADKLSPGQYETVVRDAIELLSGLDNPRPPYGVTLCNTGESADLFLKMSTLESAERLIGQEIDSSSQITSYLGNHGSLRNHEKTILRNAARIVDSGNPQDKEALKLYNMPPVQKSRKISAISVENGIRTTDQLVASEVMNAYHFVNGGIDKVAPQYIPSIGKVCFGPVDSGKSSYMYGSSSDFMGGLQIEEVAFGGRGAGSTNIPGVGRVGGMMTRDGGRIGIIKFVNQNCGLPEIQSSIVSSNEITSGVIDTLKSRAIYRR